VKLVTKMNFFTPDLPFARVKTHHSQGMRSLTPIREAGMPAVISTHPPLDTLLVSHRADIFDSNKLGFFSSDRLFATLPLRN